jgi:hypothetical protein
LEGRGIALQALRLSVIVAQVSIWRQVRVGLPCCGVLDSRGHTALEKQAFKLRFSNQTCEALRRDSARDIAVSVPSTRCWRLTKLSLRLENKPMLRHSLLSLTALAAFATPALAASPRQQQTGSPTNIQTCVTHCEGKSEGHAVAIPAPADLPRSDGTMRNGLLPNPPTYG